MYIANRWADGVVIGACTESNALHLGGHSVRLILEVVWTSFELRLASINTQQYTLIRCCATQVDAPPYSIANNNVRLPLSFRAIPVTARHHDGSLQYDTHNIYGLSQAAATYRALDNIYAGRGLSIEEAFMVHA